MEEQNELNIVDEPREPRAYEFSFLVKREEDVAEVTKLLSQHGGEIVSEGPVRHIQLSYPIEKQNEAFFGFLHVRLAPAAAKQLETDALMNKSLLRTLLVLLPRTPQPPPPRPRGERPVGVPGQPAERGERPAPRTPESSTLSNAELEKKIEEILA